MASGQYAYNACAALLEHHTLCNCTARRSVPSRANLRLWCTSLVLSLKFVSSLPAMLSVHPYGELWPHTEATNIARDQLLCPTVYA